MFGELALGVWSAAGIGWWIVAAGLVGAERRRPLAASNEGAGDPEFLSIFKPLAPVGDKDFTRMAAGLESFLGQMDGRSEMLLGVHEGDREVVAPFLERMRGRYPQARVKAIFRAEPDGVANPKIAWEMFLAPQAEGALWMWSDADIVAPAGFLRAMREEFAEGGVGMLTFPYVVRDGAAGPGLLDALYVNAEFYPGVLLLRRLGTVDFGLGAGMLFRRSDFLREVEWRELGAALADDFILGQKLKPVRVSGMTLATAAEVSTWQAAVRHYLRWSKTVWWNRPVGAAARVAILPVLGWSMAVAWHPGSAWAWTGLVLMMQVDVVFAVVLCRGAGCALGLRELLVAEAWSLGRVLAWLSCWLPWPVEWAGRCWWGPRTSQARVPGRHETIDKN